MFAASLHKWVIGALLVLTIAAAARVGQTHQGSGPPQTPKAPTRADILRGEYGRYRANNDLLFYHLDVRVDPEKKFLSGKNTIRFKMLKDDTRIQLDLHEALKVDKILFRSSTSNVQSSKSGRESGSPKT